MASQSPQSQQGARKTLVQLEMQAMPCSFQSHFPEEVFSLHGLQRDPREEVAMSATHASQCKYCPARLCLQLDNLDWVMYSGYTVLKWIE